MIPKAIFSYAELFIVVQNMLTFSFSLIAIIYSVVWLAKSSKFVEICFVLIEKMY